MKNLRFLVISMIVIAVAFFSQSFKAMPPDPELKNIKAFPSTMTYRQVDHEMDVFKVALGVKCNYCHVQTPPGTPRDLASDANPKKEIARAMIRMTRDMNEKYMSTIAHADTTTIQAITCNTCHRGAAKPANTDNVLKEN
jgi:hypothetical protein